jgi:O-antigen/teichoic acid export membrane protein
MKIKLSPFLSGIIATTATSVITILATVLVIRWLAQGLGPEEFGVYSLARRMVSMVIPLTTLAMGVALPRYLGMHHGHTPAQNSYLWGAALIAVALTTMAVLLSVPMSKRFSIWIFHDSKYVDLFFASLFMLFGFTVYTILYGYYRGIGKIKIANVWQLGVMAFGPLIVVGLLIEHGSAADMVAALGGLFVVAAAPVAYFCMKGLRELQINHVRSSIRELIRYGGPRMPAGLAFAGLLTMAPFLAPYFGTLKDAGYLVVGQSIFRVMEGAVVAFGLVALPLVARYEGEGRETALKENIRDLNAFIFQVGLFFSLHLYIWADLIILAWLGSAYQDAIPLMRVLVLSLPAYLGYVMLRSVIDAVEVRAVNTVNIFIGLGVGSGTGIVLAYAGLGVLGLAIGTTAGLFVIGAMTVFYLWKRYRFAQEMVLRMLLANGVFLLLAWVAHQWFIAGSDLMSLIYAFGIEGILFLGYLFLLWIWKVEWLVQIQKRVRI